MDFNTLIRSRGETLQRLDDLTSSYRAAEASQTENKSHKELVVSDGRDMNEARHLHHESRLDELADQPAQNMIAEIWEVPPAALGLNVNSERQAGASRLSEVVLLQWERHLGGWPPSSRPPASCSARHQIGSQPPTPPDRTARPARVRPAALLVRLRGPRGDLSLPLIRQMQAGDKGREGQNKTSEEKTELRTKRASGR